MGYQSDLDIENIRLTGNLPLNSTDGGYGVTSGSDNNYLLTLDPPLLRYEAGLSFQVVFHETNTGDATLNINGLGALPIRVNSDNSLTDVVANDLAPSVIYEIKLDGNAFQLIAPIVASAIPSADTATLPQASTSVQGVGRFATQAELANDEVDDLLLVSSVGLRNFLATEFKFVFQSFEPILTPSNPTLAVQFVPDAFAFSGAKFKEHYRIAYSGELLHSFPSLPTPAHRIWRLMLGDDELISSERYPNAVGKFFAEVVFVIDNGDFAFQVGYAKLCIDGLPPIINSFALSNHDLTRNTNVLIRGSIQSDTVGQTLYLRQDYFSLERL